MESQVTSVFDPEGGILLGNMPVKITVREGQITGSFSIPEILFVT